MTEWFWRFCSLRHLNSQKPNGKKLWRFQHGESGNWNKLVVGTYDNNNKKRPTNMKITQKNTLKPDFLWTSLQFFHFLEQDLGMAFFTFEWKARFSFGYFFLWYHRVFIRPPVVDERLVSWR
jgi:hypothetical protein